MARKVKKKNGAIESYRHETGKRKNAVPVGLASYATSKPKPKKYEYDPQIDLFAKPEMPLKVAEKYWARKRTNKLNE
ncbi:MAG: hypothetical protein M1610_06260 [Nitrospirae bacterium]|nr:hypothetical protein [Nitrospirota bacterium]